MRYEPEEGRFLEPLGLKGDLKLCVWNELEPLESCFK